MGVENLRQFQQELVRLGEELPREAVVLIHRRALLLAHGGMSRRIPVDTGFLRGSLQATGRGLTDATGAFQDEASGRLDPTGEIGNAEVRALAEQIDDYDLSVISVTAPYAGTVDEGGYVPPNPVDSPLANKRRAQTRSEAKQADVEAQYGDPGAPLVSGGYSLRAPEGFSSGAYEETLAIIEAELNA